MLNAVKATFPQRCFLFWIEKCFFSFRAERPKDNQRALGPQVFLQCDIKGTFCHFGKCAFLAGS